MDGTAAPPPASTHTRQQAHHWQSPQHVNTHISVHCMQATHKRLLWRQPKRHTCSVPFLHHMPVSRCRETPSETTLSLDSASRERRVGGGREEGGEMGERRVYIYFLSDEGEGTHLGLHGRLCTPPQREQQHSMEQLTGCNLRGQYATALTLHDYTAHHTHIHVHTYICTLWQ